MVPVPVGKKPRGVTGHVMSSRPGKHLPSSIHSEGKRPRVESKLSRPVTRVLTGKVDPDQIGGVCYP